MLGASDGRMASWLMRYCMDRMAVIIRCGDAFEWLHASRNGRSRSWQAGAIHTAIRIRMHVGNKAKLATARTRVTGKKQTR